MRKFKSVLVAGAAGLAMASTAGAAISYSYVTPQTSYSIPLGQSVTIPIYLQETLTSGSTSLINGDGGLYSGGFSVTQKTTGAGTLTGVAGSVSSNGSNFPGGFNGPDPSDTSSSEGFDQTVSLTASSGVETNSSSQIELGSITITPAAAGTDTYALANYTYPAKTGGYTTTFNTSYDLDVTSTSPAYTGASNNPESFTVTATPVPEPASLALLGLGGAGLLARRRRNA